MWVKVAVSSCGDEGWGSGSRIPSHFFKGNIMIGGLTQGELWSYIGMGAAVIFVILRVVKYFRK